jgi:FkbM family methyltransferase
MTTSLPLTGKIKRRVNVSLRRHGFTLVGDWEVDEFAAGKHLKEILDVYRIDCVLDVGANQGQFRDFAVKAGWSGPVVSFEPVSEYCDEIRKRASGNWSCHQYALGNENGTQRITVFNAPGFASLREPDLVAMDTLITRDVRQERVEAVEIRRLSDVLDRVAPGARRILLKTDTQGYDLEVFRGAKEVLDRIFALWAEVSFLPIYRNAPSFFEALSEYSGSGFAVSGMFPVCHDKELRAIEFDCALVRAP